MMRKNQMKLHPDLEFQELEKEEIDNEEKIVTTEEILMLEKLMKDNINN